MTQQGDPDMAALIAGLVGLLDVRPLADPLHFQGARKPGGVGARVSAGRSSARRSWRRARPSRRTARSIRSDAYFMRPASEDHEIDYVVEADMDGKSFSNRRVVARQDGKAVFNMTASFHAPEPGLSHQVPMPAVPPPEELGSFADYIAASPDRASPVFRRIIARPSAFDYRPVADLSPEALAQPHPGQAFCWIRIGGGPLDLPQSMQRAILGWVSDTLLLALRLSRAWGADRHRRLSVGQPRSQHVVPWRRTVRRLAAL